MIHVLLDILELNARLAANSISPQLLVHWLVRYVRQLILIVSNALIIPTALFVRVGMLDQLAVFAPQDMNQQIVLHAHSDTIFLDNSAYHATTSIFNALNALL